MTNYFRGEKKMNKYWREPGISEVQLGLGEEQRNKSKCEKKTLQGKKKEENLGTGYCSGQSNLLGHFQNILGSIMKANFLVDLIYWFYISAKQQPWSLKNKNLNYRNSLGPICI